MSQIEWVVYAKRPFAGPATVLAYLSRYTHRVAIANSRLLLMEDKGITFKWKDYRLKGEKRVKTMTLTADAFIHRFLLHVLPRGFHRLRHYGFIANANRKKNLACARRLLQMKEAGCSVQEETVEKSQSEEQAATYVCPDCGAPMIIIETFVRCQQPRAPPVKKAEHDAY